MFMWFGFVVFWLIGMMSALMFFISNNDGFFASTIMPSCLSWEYSYGLVCNKASPWTYALNGVLFQCQKWTYQPGYWATSCLQAWLWYYVDAIWAVSQKKCPLWTYQNVAGASLCKPASPWSYVSEFWATGQTSCLLQSLVPNSSLFSDSTRTDYSYMFNDVLSWNHDWNLDWIWTPTSNCPFVCDVWYKKIADWDTFKCLSVQTTSVWSGALSDFALSKDEYSVRLSDFTLIQNEIAKYFSVVLNSSTWNKETLYWLEESLIKIATYKTEASTFFNVFSSNSNTRYVDLFQGFYNDCADRLAIIKSNLVTIDWMRSDSEKLDASKIEDLKQLRDMISAKVEIINSSLNAFLASMTNVLTLYVSMQEEIKQISLNANESQLKVALREVYNQQKEGRFIAEALKSDSDLTYLIFNWFIYDWWLNDKNGNLRKDISNIIPDLNAYMSDKYSKLLWWVVNSLWEVDTVRKSAIEQKVRDLVNSEIEYRSQIWFGSFVDPAVTIPSQVSWKMYTNAVLMKDGNWKVNLKVKEIVKVLIYEWRVKEALNKASTENEEGYASYLWGLSQISKNKDLLVFIKQVKNDVNVDLRQLIQLPLSEINDSMTVSSYVVTNLLSWNQKLTDKIKSFASSHLSSSVIDSIQSSQWVIASLSRIDRHISGLVSDYNSLNLLTDSLVNSSFIKWCQPWLVYETWWLLYAKDEQWNYTVPCSKVVFDDFVQEKKRDVIDSLVKYIWDYMDKSKKIAEKAWLSGLNKTNSYVDLSWNVDCKPWSSNMWNWCINTNKTTVNWYGYWPDTWVVKLDIYQCDQKSLTSLKSLCLGYTWVSCEWRSVNYLKLICRAAQDSFRLVYEDWKIKLRWYIYSGEYWVIKFGDLDLSWYLDAVVK